MSKKDVSNVDNCYRVLGLFLILIIPGILASELSEEIWLEPGETVDLSCRSERLEEHFPQLVVRWTKDHKHITEGENVHIQSNREIRISDLQISDSGVYICQARVDQTVVRLNIVRLHVGASIQEQLIKQGGPWLSTQNSFGIPNVWVASFVGSVTVLVGFWILLILMRVYYKLKIKAYDRETPVYDVS